LIRHLPYCEGLIKRPTLAWAACVLVLGRLIVGLAIGFSSMTIPVYIAEAAPAAVRGRLVTINCVFITAGQFIAGMVDGIFAEVAGGWRWVERGEGGGVKGRCGRPFARLRCGRYMLGLAALPAVIQFVGILFTPESPRWLVQKGRVEQVGLGAAPVQWIGSGST
jgi:MFS transporter, SP family, solute carrier family 2 (myo-inositol transporter), member 13